MADGWITIGTELSTDKFDRQISALEKKMKKEEDKGIVIGAKLSSQEQELEIARKKTDELAEAYQRLKEAQDKLATGKATPMDFTTAQNLQNTFGSLDKISVNFDKALTKQDQLEAKVEGTRLQYNAINDKVNEYKQKIETIKIDKHASDVQKLQKGFSGVGTSVERVTKRISRLILSIFGIRSALMIIRRASSDLANYDQDYANKLEYIRFVLAQAIAPILKGIVNLVMTLLSYINAIAQAWFGVNLFANGTADNFNRIKNASSGSAENFNKMQSSASGVSKAVKQIKKQLSGFDEVNVLTADSDTGTSPGAGGVGMPEIQKFDVPDLSKIQGKIPKWMQWLLKNGELVKKILKGIGAVILGIKIADFLKKLGLLGEGFSTFKTLLLGLGIGMILFGIYETIQGILDFVENPSWENFAKILEGLAFILAGIGVAMLVIDAANPIGWIMLLIGVITLLVAEVIKHWDEIKEVLGKVGQWIYDHVIKPVGDFFQKLWNKITEIFSPFIDFFKSLFGTMFENVKITLDNMRKIFKFLWDKIKEIFKPVAEWFSDKFNKAKEAIKRVFEPIISFFSNLWDRVKTKLKEFGEKVGEVIGGAFKNVMNSVIDAIEWILNTPIQGINGLISAINNLGLDLGYLQEFHLPRLAVGGIVNMPNKGTMVGGRAIAGESGAEGIIPLTDTQAMETLGEAIGRYITINATIENRMNGRVISRELKEVRSNQDFAFNT